MTVVVKTAFSSAYLFGATADTFQDSSFGSASPMPFFDTGVVKLTADPLGGNHWIKSVGSSLLDRGLYAYSPYTLLMWAPTDRLSYLYLSSDEGWAEIRDTDPMGEQNYLRVEISVSGEKSSSGGYYKFQTRLNSPLTQRYRNIANDPTILKPSSDYPIDDDTIITGESINTNWITFMSGEWFDCNETTGKTDFVVSRGKFTVLFAVNTIMSSIQIYSNSFNQASGRIFGYYDDDGADTWDTISEEEFLTTEIHACAHDHKGALSIYHSPAQHDRDKKFEDAVKSFFEWFYLEVADKKLYDEGELIPSSDRWNKEADHPIWERSTYLRTDSSEPGPGIKTAFSANVRYRSET